MKHKQVSKKIADNLSCESEGMMMDQNNKTCPSCNGLISADVEHCPYCGADVSSPAEAQTSGAVPVSTIPVESISFTEEKLPDAFGGTNKSENEKSADNPESVTKETLPENEPLIKNGESIHIPTYVPTPKPVKPEVMDAKEEIDNLPPSINEIPMSDAPSKPNGTKNVSKNPDKKIWLWVIISVAVLFLLCLCGVLGFFVAFKSA
jgi:RNA polymerase subunit RPABC4/transcription elongation factor Spt4